MSNCVTNLHPQSEQIGEAFYEVRWYGESREFRHLIRMMLMRTNRGFRLVASGGGGAGGLSPLDDVYQSFDVQERGSRVSLNENSVPKHRKTRFQQSFTAMRPSGATGVLGGIRPRARFEDTRLDDETGGRPEGGQAGGSGSPAASGSGGFGGQGPKKKRSGFMPGKSLATATKLINQHLFGIQNVGAKGG